MNDEQFDFISDVKEKKTTARSARNRRTHCGKGGSVQLPSDNLSRKELQKMNGEVKSYRLNDPMKWEEYKALPDDLKVCYVKQLREKFSVPDCEIASMMGCDRITFGKLIRPLGLGLGKTAGGRKTWDKAGWNGWLNGGRDKPIAAPEGPKCTDCAEAEGDIAKPDEHIRDDEEHSQYHNREIRAIPRNGGVTFTGAADAALHTLSVLLGGANVKICVSWEVLQDETENT